MDCDPAMLGLLACICIIGITSALNYWNRTR